MKKMIKKIALLSALSLALALGGCKSGKEPESATVETAAEPGGQESGGQEPVSQVAQDYESEPQTALETENAVSEEAQSAESGAGEAEVQEDTFEDE